MYNFVTGNMLNGPHPTTGGKHLSFSQEAILRCKRHKPNFKGFLLGAAVSKQPKCPPIEEWRG